MKNLEFGIPYPVKIGIFNYFLEIRDVVTRHETRRLCESHTHTYRYIYIKAVYLLNILCFMTVPCGRSSLPTSLFHCSNSRNSFPSRHQCSCYYSRTHCSVQTEQNTRMQVRKNKKTTKRKERVAVGRMQWWHQVRREGNETVYWQTRERKRRSYSVQPAQ